MSLIKRCRHNCCGSEYKEEENTETSCTYHPGVPQFHDALKGWTCCSKRVRDFSEFLSIPGCTSGKHDDTEPIKTEPEKPKIPIPEQSFPQNSNTQDKPRTIIQRDSTQPRVRLEPKVSATLKKKIQEKKSAPPVKQSNIDISDTSSTTSGKVLCQNNTCSVAYEGPQTDTNVCLYHPGSPIFHEGMKYWSCCKSKVFDFEEMLSQPGCTQGKHCWKKPKVTSETQLRRDWYQTGRDIILSFFAKEIDYENAVIEVNNCMLYLHIQYEDQKEYETLIELTNVIDPSNCTCELLPSKIEMKLRKGDGSGWKKLSVDE